MDGGRVGKVAGVDSIPEVKARTRERKRERRKERGKARKEGNKKGRKAGRQEGRKAGRQEGKGRTVVYYMYRTIQYLQYLQYLQYRLGGAWMGSLHVSRSVCGQAVASVARPQARRKQVFQARRDGIMAVGGAMEPPAIRAAASSQLPSTQRPRLHAT